MKHFYIVKRYISSYRPALLSRCSIGFRSGLTLGQVMLFTSLKTLMWFLQCVWDRCHVETLLSCQAIWDWESSFHSFIVPSITSCTHAAPYQHTPTSMLYCQHYTVSVHAKHAGPSDPNSFLMVSSDQRMCCQYSSGFFSSSLLKFNLALLWHFVSNGLCQIRSTCRLLFIARLCK